MSQQKRKRVMVTIQQKLEILQKLDHGATIRQMAAEYNLGSSTVHDIKRNREKLLEFSSSMVTSRVGIDQRQTMKESPFAILNKAVLQWFNHERTLGHLISGSMIVQRAKELFVTLSLEGTFDGSNAWLCRFKDRYGIGVVGDSLDCVWTRMDITRQQGLDSEASNAEEAIKGECFPDMEDADDVSIVPEETNNGISLQNKSEVLEGQSIEDSPSSMPKMVPNDTDIRNINTAEQDESVEDSCVCHNLSSIVQKLQSVSDKLVADSLCDSYDDFSKYISSLLRGLPKKKALNLKKKLVNDIIEVWLAHERDDQVSSLSETTPKKVTSKQVFSRNVDHSRQLISSVTSNSQESTSMESIPVLISNQTTSLSHMNQPQYHNINIVPGADVPVVHHPTTITECESIRTVTSTANGTLLAITLPSRGSAVGVDVCRKPPPLISTRIKGLKRKRDSDESASKRVTAMTSFPVADHSTAIINEDSECNSLIKPDGTETGYDLEDSKEISDINLSEELAEEHLDMILIKQEEPDPLEEDNEDVAQLFLCDLCLTHCPTKEELIQHFQQDHPGCVPTFKEDNL